MAEMLELKWQLVLEPAKPILGCEILYGRGDKALGDFKRGSDLDAGRGARVEDRDRSGHQGRDKIDDSYRYEKLGPDRLVIPKLLQHDETLSTPALPQTATTDVTGGAS